MVGRDREYNYCENMENLYITKVVRVGNSLGVIIPKNILVGINFKRGDTIMFSEYAPGQVMLRCLTDIEIRNLKIRVAKI